MDDTISPSSILKSYSQTSKSIGVVPNRVRFTEPARKTVEEILVAVNNGKELLDYQKLLKSISDDKLSDDDLARILKESKKCIYLFDTQFTLMVNVLLAINWTSKNENVIENYQEFLIELIVARNIYTSAAISRLVANFLLKENDDDKWELNKPTEQWRSKLKHVHDVIIRLIKLIPMLYEVLLPQLGQQFPYFKKADHILSGYMFNMLWITDYAGHFREDILEIIFAQLITIDVNAPRNEIEDAEYEEEDEDDTMFNMEDETENSQRRINDQMKLFVAETLDVCMEQMFAFFENSDKNERTFKILLNLFEHHILPTHNTHHIQFFIFHFCSFKLIYAEQFINILWNNVCNPNLPSNIRQTSVGYLASLLARANFIPLMSLKSILLELSTWAHQYIQRTDSVRNNNSIKAHTVFYCVCQAIFYVIAFRSKNLTSSSKNLTFLQSLQLSSLVTCHLNPLGVCLPAVATAFAGVTRAHQLAYCHTILERNARRKLATVYSTESQAPDECLDSFFPFDPYLLKKSGRRIDPLYLQYQPSEAEEDTDQHIDVRGRKRMESVSEDVDDFLQDKKLKLREGRSIDNEMQFTYSYGVSPGFHN